MGVIFGEALMISIDRTVTSFKRIYRVHPLLSQPASPSFSTVHVVWNTWSWVDYGGGECWAYTNELNGAGLGGLGWLFERAVRALRDNSLEIASEIMM